MVRTCQLNNSWSGSSTSCDIMLCEELQPPSNGFLVLPCSREFQSVCNLTCEEGYYREGPNTQSCEVSDSGIVQWSTAPVCRGMYIQCIFNFNNFLLYCWTSLTLSYLMMEFEKVTQNVTFIINFTTLNLE